MPQVKKGTIWEKHSGLDFSPCLGMHSVTCLRRRYGRVPGSKNNRQSWGNRDITDRFI